VQHTAHAKSCIGGIKGLQTKGVQAQNLLLIDCPGYTYRVMVTSVPYAAEVVSRMYAGRADSENRIKELIVSRWP
jgi:hypothetical protein